VITPHRAQNLHVTDAPINGCFTVAQ